MPSKTNINTAISLHSNKYLHSTCSVNLRALLGMFVIDKISAKVRESMCSKRRSTHMANVGTVAVKSLLFRCNNTSAVPFIA